MNIFGLLCIFVTFPSTFCIRGFQYADNKDKYKWGKDNGIVTIKFDTFLPEALTVCMRVKSLYMRHGNQMIWFEVHINNDGKKNISLDGDFFLMSEAHGSFYIDSNGNDDTYLKGFSKKFIQGDKEKYPTHNILRKWIHFCVGADFINGETTLLLNGENVTKFDTKFSDTFPAVYYNKESRSNGSVLPNFKIEFGRYSFDQNPIIGNLMDINVWDKLLTEEEMMKISSCYPIHLGKGNL